MAVAALGSLERAGLGLRTPADAIFIFRFATTSPGLRCVLLALSCLRT